MVLCPAPHAHLAKRKTQNQSAKRETRSAKRKTRSAKRKTRSAKRETRSAKREAQSARCCPSLRWPLSAILALCSSPYFLFQLPAFFFFFFFFFASTFSPSFFQLSPPAFFHFLPQLFVSSALQGSPVDNLDKLRACAIFRATWQ